MVDEKGPGFAEAAREWLLALHPTDTVARVFADALEAGSSMTQAEIEAVLDGDLSLDELDRLTEIYGPRFFLDVSGKVIGETYEEYLARTTLN